MTPHSYPADYLKTNLKKFAALNLSKKSPKSRVFFAPNKLENHSSEGIERRRRKSEGEKRMKREKSYGFISVSLRFLAERKAA